LNFKTPPCVKQGGVFVKWCYIFLKNNHAANGSVVESNSFILGIIGITK